MTYFKKIFESKKAIRIALIAFGLVCVITVIQMFHKAFRPGGYDFTCYLVSAKSMLEGQSPYHTSSPFLYIYPLTWAILAIPLAVMPYWLANLLWFGIGLASLIFFSRYFLEIYAGATKKPFDRLMIVPMVAAFFLVFEVIQNNFLNGQINFLIILLTVAFIKRQSEGKWIQAALLLSLAISIKLIPAVFCLWLLTKKDFKTFALVIALTSLFLFAPYAVLGEKFFEYYRIYLNDFIFPQGIERKLGGSFTPYGFFERYFPGLASAKTLKIISLVVFLTPPVLLQWFRKMDAYAVSLYFVAIVLLLPTSETQQLSWMLPAYLLIFIKLVFDENYQTRLTLLWLALTLALLYANQIFSSQVFPFNFFMLLSLYGNILHMALAPKRMKS